MPTRCGLARPAFCEDFEHPAPGGRAGDLDEKVWSIARYGHQMRQFFVRNPAGTEQPAIPSVKYPARFCGKEFAGLLPGTDVALCSGVGVDGTPSLQLNEAYDDQGDFAFNSMRIRQPFDFAGRTGTIMVDVDAKVNPHAHGHGWWVELFVTSDAAPMPYHEAPGVLSFPRNGLGFVFMGCPEHGQVWRNGITRIFVTKDWRILHDLPNSELSASGCFDTADAKLNRLKFTISKNAVEVWASDHHTPTELRLIARADELELPFTRGYVHLQHSQYHAYKDGGVTPTQTYRWDNVGFDGPALPMPRAYEVPDNTGPDVDGVGGRLYGYYLNDREFVRLPIPGVELAGAKTAAFNFNFFIDEGRALEYRFNGKRKRSFSVPRHGNAGHILRTFSIPVPLEELVEGENMVEVKVSAPQPYPHEAVANMDLTLELGP